MGPLGSKGLLYDILTQIIQHYPMCIHSHDRIIDLVSMRFRFVWKHMYSDPHNPINYYSKLQHKYFSLANPMFGTMDKGHGFLSHQTSFPGNPHSHRPRHGSYTSHNNHSTFPYNHLLHASRLGS